jgi:hypothetical protein
MSRYTYLALVPDPYFMQRSYFTYVPSASAGTVFMQRSYFIIVHFI